MSKKEIELLVNAINNVCNCAIGESSGIGEVWNGDLDKLEQRIEFLEIHTEDDEMTESAKELFAASRHILEAIKKAN